MRTSYSEMMLKHVVIAFLVAYDFQCNALPRYFVHYGDRAYDKCLLFQVEGKGDGIISVTMLWKETGGEYASTTFLINGNDDRDKHEFDQLNDDGKPSGKKFVVDSNNFFTKITIVNEGDADRIFCTADFQTVPEEENEEFKKFCDAQNMIPIDQSNC